MRDQSLLGAGCNEEWAISNGADHRREKTTRLTGSRQRGELLGRARELEVLRACRSGERGGRARRRLGDRDDGGAVDEVVAVVAEHGELLDCFFERRGHRLLLVDEALPGAGGALVAGKREVGLEAQLADVGAVGDGERGGDLAGVVGQAGETGALEQDLEEDLGVEVERRL